MQSLAAIQSAMRSPHSHAPTGARLAPPSLHAHAVARRQVTTKWRQQCACSENVGTYVRSSVLTSQCACRQNIYVAGGRIVGKLFYDTSAVVSYSELNGNVVASDVDACGRKSRTDITSAMQSLHTVTGNQSFWECHTIRVLKYWTRAINRKLRLSRWTKQNMNE